MKIELTLKEILALKLNQDSENVITTNINDVLIFKGIILDITTSMEEHVKSESTSLIGGQYRPKLEPIFHYIINAWSPHENT